jgi:hypothetical protein
MPQSMGGGGTTYKKPKPKPVTAGAKQKGNTSGAAIGSTSADITPKNEPLPSAGSKQKGNESAASIGSTSAKITKKNEPLPSAGSKQKGNKSAAVIGKTTKGLGGGGGGRGGTKEDMLRTGTYGSASPEKAPRQVGFGRGTGSTAPRLSTQRDGGGGGMTRTGGGGGTSPTSGGWADFQNRTSDQTGPNYTGDGSRISSPDKVSLNYSEPDEIGATGGRGGFGGGGGTGSSFAPGIAQTVQSLGLSSVEKLRGKSVEETVKGARRTKKTSQKKSL